MALNLPTAKKNKTRNGTDMRKTLFILATIASTASMAQNSNVVSAYMALEDNKLAEAAGYIEPTITNEGTMVKEKTWRYRGMIYQRIAFSDDAAIKAQFPDAMENPSRASPRRRNSIPRAPKKKGMTRRCAVCRPWR